MSKKANKAMTLRLPLDQAKLLEAVAEVDQMSIAQAVRVAIDAHIERRRSDAEFMTRLRRSIETHRDILEQLAQ